MGTVCANHNEFYEERCRWCDSYVAASPLEHLANVVRTVVEHRIRPMEGELTAAAQTFPAFTWIGIPVAVDPVPKPILISGVLYSPCITSFPNDGHGSLE